MKQADILLVEDEADIRDMVAGYLENEGYRVVEADCGAAALKLAERERPDLIVLDVLLPDMSGLDVCAEVRKRYDMPIVFISCLDDSRDIISGLESGGDDYVAKPFDPQVLLMRVKAGLRRYRGAVTSGNRERPGTSDGHRLSALTKREADIAGQMVRGLTNEQIARELGLSVTTVKWFNTQIFGKLDVKNRAEAIAKLLNMRYPRL